MSVPLVGKAWPTLAGCVGVPLCALIGAVWISFDIIGRATGHAAIRAMQQDTRHIASRIDVHPLGVPNDTTSTLLQPSKNRLTEERRRPDEAKSLAELGGED